MLTSPAALPPVIGSIGRSFMDVTPDKQDLRRILGSDDTLRKVRNGNPDILRILSVEMRQLLTIALSNDTQACRAFAIVQTETTPIVNAILEQDLLNVMARVVLSNVNVDRKVFVRFMVMVRLCLLQCTGRAVLKCDFFAQFADYVDDICVCDMFLCLVSARTEIKGILGNFVVVSGVIEVLAASAITSDCQDAVYRVLEYASRFGQVHAHMQKPELLGLTIRDPSRGNRETKVCKWRFFHVMLNETTYPLLGRLCEVAVKEIIESTSFGLCEAYCLEFLSACCSMDTSVPIQLTEIGFVNFLFETAARLSTNTTCQLRIAQFGACAARIPEITASVCAAAVEFGCTALLAREENLPMAAVGWNLLTSLTKCEDPPVVQLPVDAGAMLEHLNAVADTPFGGDVPERPRVATGTSACSPDELIALFKLVMTRQ